MNSLSHSAVFAEKNSFNEKKYISKYMSPNNMHKNLHTRTHAHTDTDFLKPHTGNIKNIKFNYFATEKQPGLAVTKF